MIHREFGHAYPAKLIIEKDRVVTENWNRAQGVGNIDPNNFTPYPKNPVIARFFKEIGWVDELGSGVRNVYKYAPIYTPGTNPFFIEGDVFKAIIPLQSVKITEKVGEKVGENLTENQQQILAYIRDNHKISAARIAKKVGISSRKVEENISKLKTMGVIERIGPAKGGYWAIKH